MALPEAIAELVSIFDHFDIDSDGNLDRNELRRAFDYLGIPCSERDLDTLMERSTHEGLWKHEFIAFCVLKELQFFKVFHRFDSDRSGSVSFEEFSAGMAALHINVDRADEKELFEDVLRCV